jgi:hypothetical protein
MLLCGKCFKIWDTTSEENNASYGRIILKLRAKEGLQYVGLLKMGHAIGQHDFLFATINLKSHTFNFLTR